MMMLCVNAPHAYPQTVNGTPEQVNQWADNFQFILIPEIHHSSSKRHITGWLLSPGETKFEVGPVSTDLALFPWDLEKTPPSWYDYLLGSRPYQYDYEYLPSGGRK